MSDTVLAKRMQEANKLRDLTGRHKEIKTVLFCQMSAGTAWPQADGKVWQNP